MDYLRPQKPNLACPFIFPPSTLSYNVGFFDEASQDSSYGGGSLLILPKNISYLIWINLGIGSNTKSKISSYWVLLHFVASLNIVSLQSYGDSKCIIDWLAGRTYI